MVTQIDPQDLQQWIDKEVSGVDYLIVDVRGDDAINGNIPGRKNIPSDQFLENPSGFELQKVQKVIFHCALSQVRGPKCAQRFAALTGKECYVLRGGFQNWQEKYKGTKYVENLNEDYWQDPY